MRNTGAAYGFLICFVWGCAISPAEKAFRLAHEHGWHPVRYETEMFRLAGFVKQESQKSKDWTVYIEGDGTAWKDRHAISEDPSPRNPMGLRLAVLDPAPNVVYLARPGQYPETGSPKCDSRYWTEARYAPEVIHAFDKILDRFRREYDIRTYGLIGFSGGGVIAALVAAGRKDVSFLITVCSNLDIRAWTEHHRVTPLTHSLNPADFAEKLQFIPQVHFIGERDKIVPESIVRSYRDHMRDPSLTVIAVVPGYDHFCCWCQSWHRLRKQFQNQTQKGGFL